MKYGMPLISRNLIALGMIASAGLCHNGIRTKNMNHLSQEKSPYLLQHADNPVDWYPWSDEAFEKAALENKPIFLSIGYSTCHWCHVMEHESFEDPEVAELLNNSFVCVKVDREERPDIDMIYMNACRLMTGGGGWPLTIIMTPEKKPFFAATYIPKNQAYGRIGLVDLIPRVAELWRDQKERLVQDGARVANALAQFTEFASGDLPGQSVLYNAFERFKNTYDSTFGGFGVAPKFPSAQNYMFLLRYWKRTSNPEALDMVENSLRQIRRGGIYDQVGRGIHRYSTDSAWLVPHFEKMLYDQAMMIMACTETFLATGRDEFRRTAEETIQYVLRDMTDPNGGFYSAEDADSDGGEGKFYYWDRDQLFQILGSDAELFARIYNITGTGKPDDSSGPVEADGYILHLTDSWEKLAESNSKTEKELRDFSSINLEKLYREREKRIRPGKDDKVLTDWNGLMIAALSKAARAFDNQSYADAASRCVRFILSDLRSKNGVLLHRYRDGESGIEANLDDYAFLVFGLIELYESTFDTYILAQAIELNETMIAKFSDTGAGGFAFASNDSEELIARPKEIFDGALPSGNSVAAYNLIRLARLTGNNKLEDNFNNSIRAYAGNIKSAPSAFAFLLCAIDYALGPTMEIVIAGKSNSKQTASMLSSINSAFRPNVTTVFREDNGSGEIVNLAPYVRSYGAIDGKSAAYVCRDKSCDLPVTDPEKLKFQLDTE